MTKRILTTAILASLAFTAACNTVRGAGRDVESVGTAVEKTAN